MRLLKVERGLLVFGVGTLLHSCASVYNQVGLNAAYSLRIKSIAKNQAI